MSSFPEVLASLRALGPPPVGDPHAARAYAARLRAAADQVRTTCGTLARQERLAAFEGGAADRHAAGVRALVAGLQERAHRLDLLAARVEREAAALAGSQGRWVQMMHRVEAGVSRGLDPSALRHLGWKRP